VGTDTLIMGEMAVADGRNVGVKVGVSVSVGVRVKVGSAVQVAVNVGKGDGVSDERISTGCAAFWVIMMIKSTVWATDVPLALGSVTEISGRAQANTPNSRIINGKEVRLNAAMVPPYCAPGTAGEAHRAINRQSCGTSLCQSVTCW
jgi:hypothetical protein